MNFKTMLLTTAAATLIAGAASAKDFTGSLFLPAKGEVLSNTSVFYERTNFKDVDYAWEDLFAKEHLTYGVTDNFSVYGAIANAFDFEGLTNRAYNNEINLDYEVGVKYNWSNGRLLTQVGLGYYTYDESSWYGHKDAWNDDWYKALKFEAQVGYAMDNGLTPYAMFTADGDIDESDRDIYYTVFAGFHKTFDKAALDAGIRYEFETDDGSNTNEWYVQAEANYFVKDNVAVGVFGDYYLDGTSDKYIDYDYTAGVNLKVLF
ncbi:MAG: hypothetical protein J6K16_00100 [Alphaproteobacteria bacterium]|nr:hypothetical protein [Alphaproteobacteria bacterium]